MLKKTDLKIKAIELRKQGHTYSEILKQVPVAKSTLSLWLREVGLAKEQHQIFSEKKRLGALKGALARNTDRIKRQTNIYTKAASEVGVLSQRELWLIGIALYWAEGAKEKEYDPGKTIVFSNSDPRMIKIFLLWLYQVFQIEKTRINFSIAIHKNYFERVDQVRSFWSEVTDFPIEYFGSITWKKHNIRTNRKNVGNMYNGVLRIRVKLSSHLLRQITGWTKGITENMYCGIV